MSAKHNILLALILIVLVGYYVFFEGGTPPKETKILRGTPIYLIAPWDIKKVHVVTEDGDLLAERDGEQWQLLKGKPVEGVTGKIDDFVTSLLMTVEIDKFPFDENLARECKLDNPSYTVTVTDITDKTYTLLVGGKTPVGTCLYVMFADTPQIVVVGALLDYELGKLDSLMR